MIHHVEQRPHLAKSAGIRATGLRVCLSIIPTRMPMPIPKRLTTTANTAAIRARMLLGILLGYTQKPVLVRIAGLWLTHSAWAVSLLRRKDRMQNAGRLGTIDHSLLAGYISGRNQHLLGSAQCFPPSVLGHACQGTLLCALMLVPEHTASEPVRCLTVTHA